MLADVLPYDATMARLMLIDYHGGRANLPRPILRLCKLRRQPSGLRWLIPNPFGSRVARCDLRIRNTNLEAEEDCCGEKTALHGPMLHETPAGTERCSLKGRSSPLQLGCARRTAGRRGGHASQRPSAVDCTVQASRCAMGNQCRGGPARRRLSAIGRCG